MRQMHNWKLHGKFLQKAWAHWIPHTAFFQAAHLSRTCSYNAWGRGPGRSLIQGYSCYILCRIHSCSQESQQQACCWLWLWTLAFIYFPCPFMLFSLITIRGVAFQAWTHISWDSETKLREKQRYRQPNFNTWETSIGNFLLGISIPIEKLGI